MLYTLLIVLLTLDSLVLIVAVLLQSGQGQGLAATFGGVSSSASSLFGTRQTGNLLTKASWWSGGLFLFLAFLISLSSARSRAPRSVLDKAFTPPPVTAPTTNAAPGATPPAVPLQPAPTGTGTAPATGNAPATGTKTPTKTP